MGKLWKVFFCLGRIIVLYEVLIVGEKGHLPYLQNIQICLIIVKA